MCCVLLMLGEGGLVGVFVVEICFLLVYFLEHIFCRSILYMQSAFTSVSSSGSSDPSKQAPHTCLVKNPDILRASDRRFAVLILIFVII